MTHANTLLFVYVTINSCYTWAHQQLLHTGSADQKSVLVHSAHSAHNCNGNYKSNSTSDQSLMWYPPRCARLMPICNHQVRQAHTNRFRHDHRTQSQLLPGTTTTFSSLSLSRIWSASWMPPHSLSQANMPALGSCHSASPCRCCSALHAKRAALVTQHSTAYAVPRLQRFGR